MKRVVLLFSLCMLSNLYAHSFPLDAIQQKAVDRAPYLKNLIDAYNYRLSVDDQPQLVVNELISVLSHVYAEFDPAAYQQELLSKYNSADSDVLPANVLAKTGATTATTIKINDSSKDCWNVSSAQSLKSEMILAVWQDERNGVDDPDIYGQYFNLDLEPVGGNFVVHVANGGVAQNHPVVAALSDGGFIVVWEDYRHTYSAIYARRFSSNRTAVGGEFRIETVDGSQLKPAVSADANDQYTITWLQNGGTDYNVYARVYENDASAVTPTFMVNDNKDAFQWFPVVASAQSGESLVVWEDKRNGNSDIFAQRLRADGSKRAGNFQVDDAIGTIIQWQPDVTAGAGQFVVAWEDYRDTPSSIFAQWFNSSLLADGNNKRVDDFTVSAIKELPAVAINAAGETVFCWQDGRDSDFHLCAQTYDDEKNADLFLSLLNDGEQRFPQLLIKDRLLSFFWVQENAGSDVTSILGEQILWTDVPVELASFSVSLQNESVNCSWTTLSESNNLGFAVERSQDGVRFEDIAFIDGFGTTTASHHYNYVDAAPPRGDVYYRLRQVDFNGDVSYSSSQHVYVSLPTLPILLSNYPNPFNPATTISYQLDDADYVKIEILDMTGRVVKTLVQENQQRGQHHVVWNGLDAQDRLCATGLYVCKLNMANEVHFHKMILTK